MTQLSYRKDSDTFVVASDRGYATVDRTRFFSVFHDQDLIDCAAQAIECAGETITVPSTSSARGLKPRNAQRHGVQQ